MIGEEYVWTINGTTGTATAIDLYGSTGFYILSNNVAAFELTTRSEMYLDIFDSSLYGSCTVKVEKVVDSGGDSGGSSVQTASGTVTGDGTNILQIPCSFAPDLIYVYGDLSGDVTYRGICSAVIIKDEAIYASSDTSTSNTDEYASVIKGITGYNESNTTVTHATYSNNILTIDSASNSSAGIWRNGQVYNYKLVSWSSSSGGSTPSATQHNIYFEFSDGTNTTIPVYYTDSLLGTMITNYGSMGWTYNNKVITLAQLDGTTWYNPANIPLNTELVDITKLTLDTSVNENTGEEEYTQWYSLTDYMPIAYGMTFSVHCLYWGNIVFYDSSQDYISVFSPSQNSWTQDSEGSQYSTGILTGNSIPQDAAYVRLPGTNYSDGTVLSFIRTA